MRCVTVTPLRLSQEGDELRGIDWSQFQLDAAYYSDSRVSGSLAINGAWPKNQWFRIYDNDDTALMTGIITAAPAQRIQGEWVSTLTLNSTLWGMGQNIAYGDWTIQKNTYVSTVLARIFEWCGLEADMSGMAEYRLSRTALLERGKSMLSWAYSMCNLSGNRLDVDAYGHPTVTQAVLPANIPQNQIVSVEEGIVGGISRETDEMERPGRVIVVYTNEDTVIEAHVDATGDASMESRGYLLTDYHEVTDLSPATYAGALAKARTLMAKNSTSIVTWELYGKEAWWPGTGVTLRVDDPMHKGDRQCFVRNLSMKNFDKDRPVCDMTLKEVGGRDEDDA